MADWIPPEGMVACEVGPVEARQLPSGPYYDRLVGHVKDWEDDGSGYVWMSVYRPCNAAGEWV